MGIILRDSRAYENLLSFAVLKGSSGCGEDSQSDPAPQYNGSHVVRLRLRLSCESVYPHKYAE